MGCYIWYSKEGPRRAAASPSPILAVPNVTAHPSTASACTNFILFDMELLLPPLYKGLNNIITSSSTTTTNTKDNVYVVVIVAELF